MSIEQIGNAGMQQINSSVTSNSSVGVVEKQVNKPKKEFVVNPDAGHPYRPSEKQIEEAVDSTNKELERLETNLRFSVHKQTKQIMVKIIDTKTEEVIKELPPEKLLDMVASMMVRAGLIVDTRGEGGIDNG